MEFRIKILCKKEDREIVRGCLRQFSGDVYRVWCEVIKED